jgi:hypothetical protein
MEMNPANAGNHRRRALIEHRDGGRSQMMGNAGSPDAGLSPLIELAFEFEQVRWNFAFH